MSPIEILTAFRIGAATWDELADAFEVLRAGDITDEFLSELRSRGNSLSDSLGDSIDRREAEDGS